MKSTDDGSGPRKKRKTEMGALSASDGLERSATSFALTSSLASVVLTSLPLQLLQGDDLQALKDNIQRYYRHTYVVLKNATKHISFAGGMDVWSYQTLAAFMLRLRYALNSDRKLQLTTDIDVKLVQKLTPLLDIETSRPHLRIEIVSALILALRHVFTHSP